MTLFLCHFDTLSLSKKTKSKNLMFLFPGFGRIQRKAKMQTWILDRTNIFANYTGANFYKWKLLSHDVHQNIIADTWMRIATFSVRLCGLHCQAPVVTPACFRRTCGWCPRIRVLITLRPPAMPQIHLVDCIHQEQGWKNEKSRKAKEWNFKTSRGLCPKCDRKACI